MWIGHQNKPQTPKILPRRDRVPRFWNSWIRRWSFNKIYSAAHGQVDGMMVKKKVVGWLIGWLLFNAISAVFQPFHGGKGGEGRKRGKVCHSDGRGSQLWKSSCRLWYIKPLCMKESQNLEWQWLVYLRLPVKREITAESHGHVIVTKKIPGITVCTRPCWGVDSDQ